jgi:hypothetical protein
MTNEQINHKLAVEVMGWKLVNSETGKPAKKSDIDDALNNDGWHWSGRDGDGYAWQWKPSTDISHAMDVVEKIRGASVCMRRHHSEGSKWIVEIGWTGHSEHDSLPMAICLAALAWADAKKGTP